MFQSIVNSMQSAVEEFGAAWNRFWFTPADARPLAALRILVGLIAIYWVATFSPDLSRLFSREGMLPVATVRDAQAIRARIQEGVDPGADRPVAARFSYLDTMRSEAELWIGHALGLAVLLLFTCGLFTRISSVLSLLVVLSYYHRAPMLATPFEPVLAFAMLYLCLAPAGSHWSLDAMHRKTGASETVMANIAQRLLQVHLAIVYAMTAIGMLAEGGVWLDGTAIWWLMARPESRWLDLTGLHSVPLLVHAATFCVLLLNMAFPIFISKPLARPFLLVASTLMWVVLAPITGLGLFCSIMIALNVVFVSGDTLQKFVGGRRASARA